MVSCKRIQDFPLYERPRERLFSFGPSALSDAELLAVILRTGSKGENVVELSRRLLVDYDLKALSRVRVSSLRKAFGVGVVKACQLVACFELGRRVSRLKGFKGGFVSSSGCVAGILMAELSNLKEERFIVLFLDSRKRIIKRETIFVGSLDSSIVHPREIFKLALSESAAAVIMAHNHPSGDPSPSDEDIRVSRQLRKAGDLLGIKVLDHIIVGDGKYVSMGDNGLF